MQDACTPDIAGHGDVFEPELTPAVAQPDLARGLRVWIGDRQVLDGDPETLAATESHERCIRVDRISLDHCLARPVSLEYETLVGDAHNSREHPAGYVDGVAG